MRTWKGEKASAHYMEGRPESYAKSEKPWRCLCLGFTVHNINTRLRRFTTLQYSHIRRTAALTFIACYTCFLFACLLASFLSLFSFSSTKTLKPKPQIDATNQRLQQTSRLLLASFLSSCKEDSTLNLTLKQVAPIITRLGPRNLQAFFWQILCL